MVEGLQRMRRSVTFVLAACLLASGCARGPATTAGPGGPPSIAPRESPGSETSVAPPPEGVIQLREMATDIEYRPGMPLTVVSPVAGGPWPVVVILHGYGVGREFYYDLAKAVAERGAVAVVPAWDSSLPGLDGRRPKTITEGLDDIADAMRFIRLNAPKYGGDANRLVLVGHSLGGAFAMTIALAGDRFGTDALPHDVSPLPDACVSLDGIVPFRETLWREDLRALYDGDPATWDKINPDSYMDESGVREGVEFRYFVATLDFAACESMVGRMRKSGYTASVSSIDVGHMEAAEPQTETVAAIGELAHRPR